MSGGSGSRARRCPVQGSIDKACNRQPVPGPARRHLPAVPRLAGTRREPPKGVLAESFKLRLLGAWQVGLLAFLLPDSRRPQKRAQVHAWLLHYYA